MATGGSCWSTMPLPRGIANQVEYLLHHSPLPIQVESFRKGQQSVNVADRFSVLVPCFLDFVKWEVVFNCHNPCWPPDIIFGSDDTEFQPISTSQSACSLLRNWDVKDPTRLLRLLVELRAQYLLYQRKRVEEIKDSRLHFEFDTLNNIEGLEMGLITEGDIPHVVFSIPLREVDLTALARNSQISSKMQLGILLQVKYRVQQDSVSSSAVPQLRLQAPYILKDVFTVDDIKLPPWADNMCLMEYLPKLQELLRAKVREASFSLTLRRSFIEALVPFFGRPLETETVYCKRASVIAALGSFTFLVHIFLSTQFPKLQPRLLFQSSQHFDTQGRPISRSCDTYPWSPRWDADEMASRICDFITEESTSFKKYCNDSLQHHQ